MEQYVSVGYTKKAHGTRGELKLKIEDEYLEDIMNAEVFFLNLQQRKVPFFRERIKISGALLVKFEDIDNKEAAIPLTSKEIFLRAKDLLPPEEKMIEIEETLQFKKYVGYTVYDKEEGLIGKIEEILEYPHQEMILVKYLGEEIIFPIHEKLIEKIDDHQKEVWMDLPTGILDLLK